MTTGLSAMSSEPMGSVHADSTEMQTLGFWIYLMSDIVLFGTLFASFVTLRSGLGGGPSGKEIFEIPYVFLETLVLLFSSGAYGVVMIAMREGRKNSVLVCLGITFFLGACFVGLELAEFSRLIAQGYGPDRSAFLSSFFTLVGTHGTHVTFGLIWMVVMVLQVKAKGLTMPVRSRLIRLGMFWHFLDVVWVGIFSAVYLMGVL